MYAFKFKYYRWTDSSSTAIGIGSQSYEGCDQVVPRLPISIVQWFTGTYPLSTTVRCGLNPVCLYYSPSCLFTTIISIISMWWYISYIKFEPPLASTQTTKATDLYHPYANSCSHPPSTIFWLWHTQSHIVGPTISTSSGPQYCGYR